MVSLAEAVPGVDPFVGWVLGGLVSAVCILSWVIYKLAQQVLKLETRYAALLARVTAVLEEFTR